MPNIEGCSMEILLLVVLAAGLIYLVSKNKKKKEVKEEVLSIPPWFDWVLYLDKNPDLNDLNFNQNQAWAHYDNYGRLEKRPPYFGNDAPYEPVLEEPNDNTRLIVDTDMSPGGDPDDVQCYIAQASSWPSLYNVKGIVSTTKLGKGSDGAPFVRKIVEEMNKEVSSKYYPVYNVLDNDEQFYRDEILDNFKAKTKLEIHVWGSIKTLTKAILGMKDKLNTLEGVTVYWVANWNRIATPEFEKAWEDLKPYVKFFDGFYRDEEGFRGIMRSGNVSKLDSLQKFIQNSPVGKVYNRYPIKPNDITFAGRWKAGDLSLYFYSTNNEFRNKLFKKSSEGGFVADGRESELLVASNEFRDGMVATVKRNVNRK